MMPPKLPERGVNRQSLGIRAMRRLGFFLIIFITLAGARAYANDPCPPNVAPGGLDFYLPCIVHPLPSPIPGKDISVFFTPGSAALSSAAKKILDRQAEILQSHADFNARLIGFADTREAIKSSQKSALATARASAVKAYLVNHGINAERLTVVGSGYSPIIPRHTTEEVLASMRYVWTYATER